jgi:pyridoxal phosphate enzyme (YggS family)
LELQSSYSAIQQRIREACQSCGRNPESVKLVVASKSQSPERISQLHALGQKFFGENYAQELFGKATHLPQSIEWSFIGQLQSNKIKRIMMHAREIQSVGSLKHAQLIARYAEELGKKPYPIFIEAHLPGEDTKGGVAVGDVLHLAKIITEDFPDLLKLEGLMAIPPQRFAKNWDVEGETLYRTLRELANRVGARKLSLGMSGDFENAIRCGSDIVRIGSSVMGGRT